MSATRPSEADAPQAEARFHAVVGPYRPALARLAGAYEADPERRRDLEQELLLGLWRALPAFEGRSSVRTWLYRVAHNVAITAALRARRERMRETVSIEALEAAPAEARLDEALDARDQLARLRALVARLVPLDRQVLLLHLEGLPAAEIAEVTGLKANNVSVKVHRIKNLLQQRLSAKEAP
jgi:RNA polymerase sigma-70 factor (ECF subfamily)